MITLFENEVYKIEREEQFSPEQTVTFKLPEPSTYKQQHYDWYMTIALEKSDKVKEDRHLLTGELLKKYRWAIREGFNHCLDPALKNNYDQPRNRNTVAGIKAYIERIEKASDDEMQQL